MTPKTAPKMTPSGGPNTDEKNPKNNPNPEPRTPKSEKKSPVAGFAVRDSRVRVTACPDLAGRKIAPEDPEWGLARVDLVSNLQAGDFEVLQQFPEIVLVAPFYYPAYVPTVQGEPAYNRAVWMAPATSFVEEPTGFFTTARRWALPFHGAQVVFSLKQMWSSLGLEPKNLPPILGYEALAEFPDYALSPTDAGLVQQVSYDSTFRVERDFHTVPADGWFKFVARSEEGRIMLSDPQGSEDAPYMYGYVPNIRAAMFGEPRVPEAEIPARPQRGLARG